MTKKPLQSANGRFGAGARDRGFEGYQPKASDKFSHMNHHHDLTPGHEIVEFGGVEFVANKAAIPLLGAVHDLGLRTRTHHIDGNSGFVSILIDRGVTVDVRQVEETGADRSTYNGQTELLIQWCNPTPHKSEPDHGA